MSPSNRIHVLCGRAFKRPQDLKKHEKLHADGSIDSSDSLRANRPIAQPKRTRKDGTYRGANGLTPPPAMYESSASPYSTGLSSNGTPEHLDLPDLSPYPSSSSHSPAPSDDLMHTNNARWFAEPTQLGDSLKRSYTMDDFVTDIQRKRLTNYNDATADALDRLAIFLQQDSMPVMQQFDPQVLDGTDDFLTQLMTEIGSDEFWNITPDQSLQQQPITKPQSQPPILPAINTRPQSTEILYDDFLNFNPVTPTDTVASVAQKYALLEQQVQNQQVQINMQNQMLRQQYTMQPLQAAAPIIIFQPIVYASGPAPSSSSSNTPMPSVTMQVNSLSSDARVTQSMVPGAVFQHMAPSFSSKDRDSSRKASEKVLPVTKQVEALQKPLEELKLNEAKELTTQRATRPIPSKDMRAKHEQVVAKLLEQVRKAKAAQSHKS
ncbi:hypothetical protein SmJEL517_g02454 [Synchytrium microbalum]|uniref:C2H2-type domain-containing protein n=1 Tax=Synchytrium microbalum TaxID=1806994 RepID=A0A507C6Y5_9FUNG|nr:uncharacterized protein SmJEL517_g02454 [Synchytrium microbalum]TPX35108.1 hypothetical protein SmJEL517_g02454 [Synchytrium microbalum]